MTKNKHIHFVGIKGVGMTPLAIIAKEAGFTVSGCDIEEEFITDEALRKAGINPLIGFSKEHIKSVDLVITTGAHGGFDNEEVKSAREQGIQIMTQGQAVGVFMKGDLFGKKFEGISVAGSHGKTTTTAIIATILREGGLDPSYVVGTGMVASLGSAGHFGRGKYFVAEADEYMTEPKYDKTVKFLWQHPKILVITNIEFDHPDVYESIDSMQDAYLKFANQLPNDGVLIASKDDPQVKKLLKEYQGRVITFGYSPQNDFILKKVSISDLKTFFWVATKDGTSLGEFVLNVPGEHNGLNALASIVAALECGLDIAKIKKALIAFSGSKRRFEYIGKLQSGGLIFDDYAHHPTEIQKTLLAFRQSFPKKKIVCIFQPHTYSRTKALFEEFVRSFGLCDTLILTDIYPSLREKPDQSVSSEKMALSIERFHKEVLFLPRLLDVVEYINQKQYKEDTLLVTMGAGDVYKIASSLLWRSLL
ncbi:MAG: UDP-N-acetylmuramate--L-alanine ligase [Candidatus Levybacteria bacterium]|nr:UDP-N-acetylmuramate--L-alanine ligase [Candidatus Levybacteria bacterium]